MLLRCGLSGVRAVNHAICFAFAAPAEGVVLAQGMGGVVLPEEDSAEVGVVAEADAEHVEDFAFGPFGAGPDIADAVKVEGWVFVDSVGGQAGIEKDLHEEPVVAGVAHEVVDDAEPAWHWRGIVKVIDADHVGEEVEIATIVVAQEGEHFVEVAWLDNQRGLAAKLGGSESNRGECFLDDFEDWVIEIWFARHVGILQAERRFRPPTSSPSPDGRASDPVGVIVRSVYTFTR